MTKLTRENRIDICRRRKVGEKISSLANEYDIRINRVKYLVRLVDLHGEDILRKNKNTYYSKELKQEIINKVLIEGHSTVSTAIEYGLPNDGVLFNWIKSYKENNYVIVEKTRGRKPHTMTKIIDEETPIDYESMSDEAKIKYLEKKNSQLEKSNLYLEAEAEYLKKLHAVVQKRNQQQKKSKHNK